MTKPEVIAKCRDLIEPILGASKTSRLIDTVFNIESVSNIQALRSLVQTG